MPTLPTVDPAFYVDSSIYGDDPVKCKSFLVRMRYVE